MATTKGTLQKSKSMGDIPSGNSPTTIDIKAQGETGDWPFVVANFDVRNLYSLFDQIKGIDKLGAVKRVALITDLKGKLTPQEAYMLHLLSRIEIVKDLEHPINEYITPVLEGLTKTYKNLGHTSAEDLDGKKSPIECLLTLEQARALCFRLLVNSPNLRQENDDEVQARLMKYYKFFNSLGSVSHDVLRVFLDTIEEIQKKDETNIKNQVDRKIPENFSPDNLSATYLEGSAR
jgi:hypothetical protein